MWIVWAIVVGLVVGAIARLLVPGDHPRGLFVTAVVGIAGSVVATVGGKAAGFYHAGQSAGFTFTPQTPGSLRIASLVDGSEASGMWLDLEVVGSGRPKLVAPGG